MTDDALDSLRLRDLRDFDAAIHRLFDDGLLSEWTMSDVWALVHRESEDMVMRKRIEM